MKHYNLNSGYIYAWVCYRQYQPEFMMLCIIRFSVSVISFRKITIIFLTIMKQHLKMWIFRWLCFPFSSRHLVKFKLFVASCFQFSQIALFTCSGLRPLTEVSFLWMLNIANILGNTSWFSQLIISQAEVVSASKSVKILELSDIMVLHLMRFSYGSEGSTKLHKPVHFPLELVFGRELLASPSSEVRLSTCS